MQNGATAQAILYTLSTHYCTLLSSVTVYRALQEARSVLRTSGRPSCTRGGDARDAWVVEHQAEQLSIICSLEQNPS
jgi:hypothetical protein